MERAQLNMNDTYIITHRNSAYHEINDLVKLIYDDNTSCPRFKNLTSGAEWYMNISHMQPYNPKQEEYCLTY